MYMVEISEDKLCTMSEYLEKCLRYMGKVMQCVDELEGKELSNSSYGNRRHREEDGDMMERRGMGRYNRY